MSDLRAILENNIDSTDVKKCAESIKQGKDFDEAVYEIVLKIVNELESHDEWNADYYEFLYYVIESKVSHKLKGGSI